MIAAIYARKSTDQNVPAEEKSATRNRSSDCLRDAVAGLESAAMAGFIT